MVESNVNEKLETTNQYLYRFVSYKHAFFRGIISGLGTAIGATIVFAIVIFAISRFIRTLDIPALNDLLNELNIQQIVDQDVSDSDQTSEFEVSTSE